MATRISLDALSHPIPRSLARSRRRETAAILLVRCEALPPPDRDLIRAVYADGRTVMELVRKAPADAGDLVLRAALTRRRLRRLVRRMLTPTFELVRLQADSWPATMARVGHACITLGLSMRVASQSLGLSLHTVRTHLHAIRALAQPGLSRRDRAA